MPSALDYAGFDVVLVDAAGAASLVLPEALVQNARAHVELVRDMLKRSFIPVGP